MPAFRAQITGIYPPQVQTSRPTTPDLCNVWGPEADKEKSKANIHTRGWGEMEIQMSRGTIPLWAGVATPRHPWWWRIRIMRTKVTLHR